MRNATCLALLLAAGVATADEPHLLTSQQPLDADRIGHIYYHAATGQMVRTGAHSPRGRSHPVWVNERADQCDFDETVVLPVRDSAAAVDLWTLDFGGVELNTCVDTMTFFYTTTVADPEEDGEDGYTIEFAIVDAFDIDSAFSGLAPFLVFEIAIPGSASGVAAWIMTIDLSGANAFELGDQDGISDCAGANSTHGQDQNGDGLPDFAVGFHVRHPLTATTGMTSLVLVAPPGGAVPNGLADEDVFAQLDDWCDVTGYYWFGGHDCSGGTGAWTPWASFFLGLYGSNAQTCFADLNIDGLLDFFDVQAFLNAFAAQDTAADFNEDQLFDFFDLQLFLTQFVAGCP